MTPTANMNESPGTTLAECLFTRSALNHARNYWLWYPVMFADVLWSNAKVKQVQSQYRIQRENDNGRPTAALSVHGYRSAVNLLVPKWKRSTTSARFVERASKRASAGGSNTDGFSQNAGSEQHANIVTTPFPDRDPSELAYIAHGFRIWRSPSANYRVAWQAWPQSDQILERRRDLRYWSSDGPETRDLPC
ncbi:uncharacterized protein BJ212DRAFT_1299317 [Suillus subaureus]|uniref:Uncharacterized protein n=1 Tax=Suillus subaureus TaxID=48587 RepID=A0A9P7JE75_9AGAM|nr:uncharacterized protein BJ212DRAFT_1299317 [Suillus subaureus]KAG1817150.1 hypothetical protein BJ212DRAFT_1299317 [Suillus subaureus]